MISTIANIHDDLKLGDGWEGLAIAYDVQDDDKETWRLIFVGGRERDYRDEELPFASSGQLFGRAMSLVPQAEEQVAQAIRTIQSAENYRAYQIASEYAHRLEASGHHAKLYVNYYEGSVAHGKRYTPDQFRVQLSARKNWFSSHLVVSWRTLAKGASRRTTARLTGTVHQSRKAIKVTSTRDLDAWVYALGN